MKVKPVKVALIGSGNISYTYLNTLTSGLQIVEVVGCSDLVPERSKARAELFGIRQMTNEQILSDPEIEIVVNTTELWNHNAVTKMILEAGKHAYSEKAMGHNYEGAKVNYDLAKSKGLFVGAAPDCYMGSAWQTARKLIDDGYIGIPLTAYSQCMRGYGADERPSSKAPDPMMGVHGTTITYDMAGYYLNVLFNLFGPVKRASGYSKAFNGNRKNLNTLHPDYGSPLDTSNTGESIMLGSLEFECGVYGALVLCSEGFNPEVPRVDIYGTDGVLTLPDPNNFGGWGNNVLLTRKGNPGEVFKVPFTHGFSDTDPAVPAKSGKREPCHNSWRGIAVADMAYAIRRKRQPRSNADLALHTVEILDSIDKSNVDNRVYEIKTRPERPAMLSPGRYGAVTVMESALDT
ncbi:MAG: Gfo/Idh/MocA family oxidoreductase [Treponema sp.]|jgi:predicted dehydrogenase|nr:Gfo/Idh/MocA family oxidoreductase [Treponema sp.]